MTERATQYLNEHLLAMTRGHHYFPEWDMQVYLRRTYRYIEGRRVETFEIGSADCRSPGKGNFTKFLRFIREYCRERDLVLYLESVLVDWLVDWYQRQGFTRIKDSCPPCFYLLPRRDQCSEKTSQGLNA